MVFLKELRKTNFSGQGVNHEPGQPIVEARRLGVSYGRHTALDGVTFRLLTSQRVAVVGPNGAGKSTLFKVIAGVIKPTSGEVKVYGHGPNGHICIAYVPQRSQVDWNFPVTVADVVMMGRTGKIGMLRWPGARDREIVQKSLADVGLLDLAGRQISELSGGQQQRMFIARALAQEAELILMDEPLNGLDVTSQEIIFEILDELRRRNVTVMVATHDLDHAAEMFDQVMLLKHRLVSFGLPQDVLTAENLISAYGGHLRLIEAEGVTLAVGDTCCDEDRLP